MPKHPRSYTNHTHNLLAYRGRIAGKASECMMAVALIAQTAEEAWAIIKDFHPCPKHANFLIATCTVVGIGTQT